MAKDKKSFILYCDQRGIFERLSDEQAGALIKHVFAYVSDENPEGDFITELAFESIKNSLKRDLRRWEGYIEKQRENGAKGGRPPKPKKPKPFFENPTEPKKADSVSVSVNDSVSVNVSDKQIPAYEEFKDYALDKCSELNFNVSESQVNAKYQSWITNGWRNGNGKQIKNWKSTILNTLPYLNNKEPVEKPETTEDREAREFMEQLKRQSQNEILYGNVQSNIDNNEPSNARRVQGISQRSTGNDID
jgi:hypothetical protein